MRMTSVRVTLILFSLIWTAPGVAATRPIILQVDARDVTQGIQHALLAIPVRPGPLTLAYPKWIPGEHAADGPLTQLVALQITSGSRVVAWRRDSLDPYSFHVNIPAGVNVLQVRFDYVSPPKSFGDGYGKAPDATAHLIILAFNHFILYPGNASVESIEVKVEVIIPAGWKFDTALEPERIEGGHIWLPQTTLYTLIDSPLLAGEYFRLILLTD